jgi:hypothetical protein
VANFPWKIDGWCWTTYKSGSAPPYGYDDGYWYFSSCLLANAEDPYSTVPRTPWGQGMAWDYPYVYCAKLEAKSIFPDLIYGATIPPGPCVGGNHRIQFPSSYAGFAPYWGVFAAGCASWQLPPGNPAGYLWTFGFAGPCTCPITLPSGYAVIEYVWNCRPETNQSQYLAICADEYDCTMTGWAGARMGKNYTFIMDADNGWYWCWFGSGIEAGYTLFVCDIVTIPTNSPGNPFTINPYVAYQFDLGIGCVTPYINSGCYQLQWASLGNQAANKTLLGIAGLDGWFFWSAGGGWPVGWGGFTAPIKYGFCNTWRIPHPFDAITDFFFKNTVLSAHMVMPGYPAWCFASCAGGHSIKIPLPSHPLFKCLEIRFSAMTLEIPPGHPIYPPQSAGPHSASFMTTWY